MRLFISSRHLSEHIEFCQQSDIEIGYFCGPSEFLQDRTSVLSRAKILKEVRIENLICRIRNYLPVNVVSFNCNVDWEFDDRFHKTKFRNFCFRPSIGHHQDGSKQPPSSPWRITRVKEIDFNRTSLC